MNVAYITDLANSPVMIKFSDYMASAGYHVNLKRIELGTEQLDALSDGQLDFGTLAIPPFLVAASKGLPVRIVSGVSTGNLLLNTWMPNVHSISNISPSDKIAAASGTPGLPAILLAMGAQKSLGNAKKFDSQLLNVSHSVGLQDLISHQVVAQIAPLPYDLIAQQTSGVHTIGSAQSWFGGPFNIDVLVGSTTFANAHPAALEAAKKALAESAAWITSHPAQAASLLQTEYFPSYSAAQIQSFLTSAGTSFTTKIEGLQRFQSFMTSIGLIQSIPAAKALTFP